MASQYLASQGIDLDAEMHKIQFGETGPGTNISGPSHAALPTLNPFRRVHTILNASLPGRPRGSLWDIALRAGQVQSTSTHDPAGSDSVIGNSNNNPAATKRINGHGALLAPAMCHPHVHLDKPYLLSHPKYADLQIVRGDFAEAMELTNKAKKRFEHDDLVERGRRVIDESVFSGVTAMRAFVEVDPIVGMKCLDAGITLKQEARDRCDVQLCAFAQLALFSNHDDGGEEMRKLTRSAVHVTEVDVVGSTPYVESSIDLMEKNVEWIIDLALAAGKHLDLHLDYNLDGDTEPLIWFVIRMLKAKKWTARSNKTVVLGHCTRLCLFDASEWQRLEREVSGLPISFVGLPTSDLFMMRTENQTRGTLPIVKMIKQHGLNAAIGINNVGNAFTPQGCCDPLNVASMGVGIYQAGTTRDCEILYECISTRARAAIGLGDQSGTGTVEDTRKQNEASNLGLAVETGKDADLVLFAKSHVEWRTRRTVPEAVYLYDGGQVGAVIKAGVLVD